MFLLVPAYPGCPGSKAVKRSLLCWHCLQLSTYQHVIVYTAFHGMLCHKVHMVVDKQSDKPRGYAFVEFDHERDMHGKSSAVFQSLCSIPFVIVFVKGRWLFDVYSINV